MSALLEYRFVGGRAGHADGSHEASLWGVTGEAIDVHVPGLGALTAAVRFPPEGGRVEIPVPSGPDVLAGLPAFAVEVAFSPGESREGRQNLVEGQRTAFGLLMEQTEQGVVITASVHTERGWMSVTAPPLSAAQDSWHAAGLVMTGDALILLVDGVVAGRRPLRGQSAVPTGTSPFYLGSWIDGVRFPFVGRIGLLRIWDGVPDALLAAVAQAELDGVGEIEGRWVELGGAAEFLGAPQAAEQVLLDGTVRARSYAGGELVWSRAHGVCAVWGAIVVRYRELGGPTGLLGVPVSDEAPGRSPGSRVSRFTGGWVLWSAATGAKAVHGEILAHYVRLGGEGSLLGLPTSDELPADPGGRRCEFQGGTIWWSPATGASEVHGAIRAKYLALGGPARFGFPITDESDVLDNAGSVLGKVSVFTGCAIYWSDSTGAWEVHGAIRWSYERMGGPAGSRLGFPIGDEQGVTGTDIRCSDFSGGCIVWQPVTGPTAYTDLTLRLSRVRSGAINDGIEFFSADTTAELRTFTTVDVSGHLVRNGERRSGGSTLDLHLENSFGPVQSNTVVAAHMRVEDWDEGSPNDWLGDFDLRLDIRNRWGMHDQGIQANTPLSRKGADAPRHDSVTLDWSVGRQEGVVPDANFRRSGWWRFENFSTPRLSKQRYVETFRDVGHSEGLIDSLTHPWDALFYELAYKGIAGKGNCFGMSLEAANARTGRSMFFQPLHQYSVPEDVEKETTDANLGDWLKVPIQIRQGYQLGAEAILWTLGRIGSGQALRPTAVQREVQQLLDRQDWPLLSMVDLEKGSGHCVLPYRVEHNRIYVADPNVNWYDAQDEPTYLTINPDDTFEFVGGGLTYGSGTFGAGLLPKTLLLVYPHHVLATRPCTPTYEVMQALGSLLGGVVLVAGDADVLQAQSGTRTMYDAATGRVPEHGELGLLPVPVLDSPGQDRFPGGFDPSTFEKLKPTAPGQVDLSWALRPRRTAGLPRVLASRSALPDELTLSLVGTGSGDFSTLLRTTRHLVRLEAAAEDDRRDVLQVAGSQRVRGAAHVSSSAEATLGLGWGTTGSDGVPPRAIFAQLPTAPGRSSSIGAAATGPGFLLTASGVAQPLSVEMMAGTGPQAQVVTVALDAPGAGEMLHLQPADMASPVGEQLVERLSNGGAVLTRSRVAPLRQ